MRRSVSRARDHRRPGGHLARPHRREVGPRGRMARRRATRWCRDRSLRPPRGSRRDAARHRGVRRRGRPMTVVAAARPREPRRPGSRGDRGRPTAGTPRPARSRRHAAPRHGPTTRWARPRSPGGRWPARGSLVGVGHNAHAALVVAAGGGCDAVAIVDGFWGPWRTPDEDIDEFYAVIRAILATTARPRRPRVRASTRDAPRLRRHCRRRSPSVLGRRSARPRDRDAASTTPATSGPNA